MLNHVLSGRLNPPLWRTCSDKRARVDLSASLKQDALDKLRHDRSDLQLHVPLLSGYPGMHRHILHRELNFDGQTPKLHHLAQAEPDGTVQTSSDGAFQSARILPEYPKLQPSPKKTVAMGCRFIWFVSCRQVLPADGPPLLGKHADEVLLREVACHDSWAQAATCPGQ